MHAAILRHIDFELEGATFTTWLCIKIAYYLAIRDKNHLEDGVSDHFHSAGETRDAAVEER